MTLPLLLFFSGLVFCLNLLADIFDFVVADLFFIRLIIVEIKMQKILRLHVVLVTHTEGRCPSCDTLQLVLKYASPSIALNGKQYLPPTHFIQVFPPRDADFAYDRFERFVGVGAFFTFPPLLGFISSLTVEGTKSHSALISTTFLVI